MPKTKLDPRSLLAGIVAGLMLSGTAYAAARTWASGPVQDRWITEIRSDENEKRRAENVIRAQASPSPLPALAMIGEQWVVDKACDEGVKERAQGLRKEVGSTIDAELLALTLAQKCAAIGGTWDVARIRCVR